MARGEFLYNSDYDKAVRSLGMRAYLITYGLILFIAYLFNAPAIFTIPLTSHFTYLSSASSWAFAASYPVFHLLMKSRVLESYRRPILKLYVALIGLFIIAFLVFFFSLEIPADAVTRNGRALRHSKLFAGLLLASASMTISLGIFTIIEPIRERIVRAR